MPTIYQFIPADLFVKAEDVSIYHTYKNDDYNAPYQYWYSLYDDENDVDYESFDIRELPNYDSKRNHLEILSDAIKLKFINK